MQISLVNVSILHIPRGKSKDLAFVCPVHWNIFRQHPGPLFPDAGIGIERMRELIAIKTIVYHLRQPPNFITLRIVFFKILFVSIPVVHKHILKLTCPECKT